MNKNLEKKKRKTKADWKLSDYKNDAWKVCSLYIRTKYADFDGYVSCVTCGKVGQIKEMQAGHFIPGRRGLTFFDERNIHPQCLSCNMHKHGNLIKYWPFMEKKYGKEVIEELILLDKEEKHFKKEELVEIKEYFKKKLEELCKD